MKKLLNTEKTRPTKILISLSGSATTRQKKKQMKKKTE